MYAFLYELNNANDDKWNRFHFLFLNCCLLCSSQGLKTWLIKQVQDRKIENVISKPESGVVFFGNKQNLLHNFADTTQHGSY